ncbi:hypothetical protein AAGW05_03460 [Arthrobacter sp. LAPM80]|uniref:hypothetical protein n=1 Tax=Arthrobacter sp. LAPM80 TaxID=3141788 RepID=UPI00398B30A4
MGKLGGAVQQIARADTEEQINSAAEALDTARRAIYKLLAGRHTTLASQPMKGAGSTTGTRSLHGSFIVPNSLAVRRTNGPLSP